MADRSRPSGGAVLRTILVAAGLVFSYILIVIFIYPALGTLLTALLMLAVTLTVVRANALGHRYHCGNCGRLFKPPLAVEFLTPGGISKNADGTYYNWKSLTCPECGQRTRAAVVRYTAPSSDLYRSRSDDDSADKEARRERYRTRQRRGGRKH